MQILCKGLVDSHTVLLRLNKLRQHLIDSDLGYRGICLNMPDSFLGHPLNRHSDFAEFLNAAKRAGYINKVPAEYAS
jgi:hypothetical protein